MSTNTLPLLSATLIVAGLSVPACSSAVDPAGAERVAPVALAPALATDPVTDDPDDPAIWHHPTDPSRSLIIGTNKVTVPTGAVVVFGLDGRVRQTIDGVDRPNNVDVEYGVDVAGRSVDIAVATERLQHRLRVFAIDPATGTLGEIGRVPVLEGEEGERREPMGIGLYKRPADGAVFAIVAPKTGGQTGYLAQYRLDFAVDGQVSGTLVRRFGNFSPARNAEGELGEIEAVVVDDELGVVFYSDEAYGLRKWHADPDHADAARELAVFGTDGYRGDREGLAIYATGPGTGYLLSSDQIEGGSVLKVYRREGEPGAPHEHRLLSEIVTASDETDGIEATSRALPGFEHGIVVMMNSRDRNFLVYDAGEMVAAAVE